MEYGDIAFLAVENPIMDLMYEDPERVILSKYKLELGMASLATPEQMPMYDEIFHLEGTHLVPGGSALNSCRAAKHIMKKEGYSG